MRISNKADYALHSMMYVASVNGKRASSINDISESEGIPREYLAKVLSDLVRLGLLKSTRGIFGGYFLTKPRKDYTFLTIIEAIEGPISPTLCTKPESKRKGHRRGKCPAFPLFDEIKRKVIKDMSSVNLEDIPYEKYYPMAKKNG
jgi:Rrf2 family protein